MLRADRGPRLVTTQRWAHEQADRDLRPYRSGPTRTTLGPVDGSTHIELTVARFRALGDPTRLRVVQELTTGTRCVCGLRERVDVAGPLLSHHLAVLRDAGLVTASRRGRWVDYSLDTEALTATFATVAPAGADR